LKINQVNERRITEKGRNKILAPTFTFVPEMISQTGAERLSFGGGTSSEGDSP
jgi:hypothetical protein